jgi:oligo-1,6-glucosidase
MRFWLAKGVDGFRVDKVNKYSKTYAISTNTNLPELPDAEMTELDDETQFASKLFCNGPRIHEFLLEMNDILDEYDVMTVGELPNTPKKGDVMSYISARARNLNMVFNFGVVALGQTAGARFATTPYKNLDSRGNCRNGRLRSITQTSKPQYFSKAMIKEDLYLASLRIFRSIA